MVEGTATGQPIVNVFHVYRASSPATAYTQAEITAVATAVAAAYSTRFKPLVSLQWSGDACVAQDLTSMDGVTGQSTIAGTGSGTGTNTPNSAACCISWHISRHYRGGHPRTYLGPLASANIESPTTLASGYVTNVVTAATGFIADLLANAGTAGSLVLCTLHRTVAGATLTTPLRSQITAAACDSRIDTMRRRLGPDR